MIGVMVPNIFAQLTPDSVSNAIERQNCGNYGYDSMKCRSMGYTYEDKSSKSHWTSEAKDFDKYYSVFENVIDSLMFNEIEIDNTNQKQNWGLILISIVIVAVVSGIVIILLKKKKTNGSNKITKVKKFCGKCGHTLNTKSKFCGKCGYTM